METLRPAVGRNSTLTDEARAFILFLPLSNIYCSPTPARWKFRKHLHAGNSGKCLTSAKKSGKIIQPSIYARFTSDLFPILL